MMGQDGLQARGLVAKPPALRGDLVKRAKRPATEGQGIGGRSPGAQKFDKNNFATVFVLIFD